MPFTLSGERADVRYGYRVAARLGAWEIDEGRILSARIVAIVNRFWLTRPGLDFTIPRANGGSSSRPIEDVQITGEALTARLVKPRNP